MGTPKSAEAARPSSRRLARLRTIGRYVGRYIMQAGEILCWQAAFVPYDPGDAGWPAAPPAGPPSGHPERLVSDAAMTAAERRLWAELDPGQ